MMRTLVAGAALVALLGTPFLAVAHNAGHIILPDGKCLEIGSFRDAPLVGPDMVQLDLVPETSNPPFDEYGVSFVGYYRRTDIRPGRCPAPTGSTNAPAAMESSNPATASTAGAPPAGSAQKQEEM